MSKGPSSKALVVVVLIGALGVGALALYVKNDPNAQHVADSLRQRPVPDSGYPKPVRTKHEESAPEPHAAVSIRVPAINGEQVTLSDKTVDVPEGKDPMVYLAEKVLEADGIQGVRVLGVDVRNHAAAINFSSEIDSGMSSMQEGALLKALQLGFSQFPEVSKLQLDREGTMMESLGGHIDLTDPLPVTKPPSPGLEDSKPSGSSGAEPGS